MKKKLVLNQIKDFCIRLLNINSWMLFISIVVGMVSCILTKFENNWDFMNYHYYNPWALLNGRMNYDIVPAGVNTFFNPILDFIPYGLIQLFNQQPSLYYAGQGVVFGLLIFVFWKLASLFFNNKTITGCMLSLLSTVCAITGYGTWFQSGSSTGEIPLAIFGILALYLIFKMLKSPEKQTIKGFLLAGLIMGIALGLKPTIVYLCVATGLSLMLCYKHLNKPIHFVVVFAIGGFLGFLVSNGWWMWRLWVLFENPVFPFANEVIKSPYFDVINYSSKTYIPNGWLKWVFPYVWMWGSLITGAFAETSFFDMRGIFYYTLFLGFVCFLFFHLKKSRELYYNHPIESFLFVLICLGYVLWLNIFSIYRYLIIIEMICSVFFVKIWFKYKPKTDKSLISYSVITIFVFYLFISVPTQNTGWSNRKGDQTVWSVEPVNLPENTLIKLFDMPTAGVLPLIVKDNKSRAVIFDTRVFITKSMILKVSEMDGFKKMRDNVMSAHTGPIVIIVDKERFKDDGNLFLTTMKNDLENMYCRYLKTSLDEERTIICVPRHLKDTILTNNNQNEELIFK